MAYPSIIDHVSASINFETSGQAPYLYYSEWTSDVSNGPRDLKRQPIIFLKSKSQGSDYTHPTATMDAPQQGATLTGSVTVNGWAFDNDTIAKVDILLDGNVIGTATYGFPRPDVAQANPGAPVNCGFEFLFDSKQFANGAHVIAVRAVDPTGNVSTMHAWTQAAVTIVN